MHMLLIAKLKGNAQRWLHANASRILEIFNLDDGCMHILLIAKPKAQRWLHANASRILESIDRLCEQFIMNLAKR